MKRNLAIAVFVLLTVGARADFTIMSYNLRYDSGRHPSIKTKKNEKPLAVRKAGINEILSTYMPDIIGFQELLVSDYEEVIDRDVRESYERHWYRFDDGRRNEASRMILWKTSKFAEIDSGWFEVPGSDVIKTSSWVLLEDRETRRRVFVVNNHFIAGDKHSRLRLESSRTVLETIESLADGPPVLIIGDLNAKPGSRAIAEVEDAGFVKLDQSDQSTYSKDFKSARGGPRLDYLFCSPVLSYASYTVIDTRLDVGSLPSDHLPVFARIIEDLPFDSTPLPDACCVSESSRHALADINGDGIADRVHWDHTGDARGGQPAAKMTVSPAVTGGGFADPIDDRTEASTSSRTRYYFADVDGDGCADKIHWNPADTFEGRHPQGTLMVYLARGDGTFSDPIFDRNGWSRSEETKYYFADVNGDAASDKIYWNHTNDFDGEHHRGTLKVYLANGDGTFADAIYDPNGWSRSDKTRYYFADVNGDGCADKIYWNHATDFGGEYRKGTLKIYLAKGDGTFADAIHDPNGWSSSAKTKYSFADVNGDGCADKIYWNPTNGFNGVYPKGTLKVFLADGEGTFDAAVHLSTGSSSSSLTEYYFSDVTGDGRADMVFRNDVFQIYVAKAPEE